MHDILHPENDLICLESLIKNLEHVVFEDNVFVFESAAILLKELITED